MKPFFGTHIQFFWYWHAWPTDFTAAVGGDATVQLPSFNFHLVIGLHPLLLPGHIGAAARATMPVNILRPE
jgi:hypothetical protein